MSLLFGREWIGLDIDPLSVKIDFEKTHDKVEWIFIMTMLMDLGFG